MKREEKVINDLSEREYYCVHILKALGEEKRFLILKNLRSGECYAHELADAFKISRAALEKHVRILIQSGLVEKRFLLEEGRAKTVLKITPFAKDVLQDIDSIVSKTSKVEEERLDELKSQLTELTTQINSLKLTLRRLHDRYSRNEIEEKLYRELRSRYEKELEALLKKAEKIRKRVIRADFSGL